jgi:membrane protease YdiL (CAAX protease family)
MGSAEGNTPAGSGRFDPRHYQPGPNQPAPTYPPNPPLGHPDPQTHGSPGPVAGAPPPAGLDPRAPGRPQRRHRWGLGAFLLAELVFLGVSALVAPLVAGENPSAVALGTALAVPTVLAAAVALLITRLRGNGPKADLGLVWSRRDLEIGLAFGVGGLVLGLIATAVFVAIVGPDETSAVGDLFGGQRAAPAAAVLIMLIVVLVAPVCEEILYRGMLWGALERLGAGRWVAFGVVTVIFSLAHFEITRMPLLLVISIPLGLARLYTGRLLASIVAHQINNLLPGIALYLLLTGAVPV